MRLKTLSIALLSAIVLLPLSCGKPDQPVQQEEPEIVIPAASQAIFSSGLSFNSGQENPSSGQGTDPGSGSGQGTEPGTGPGTNPGSGGGQTPAQPSQPAQPQTKTVTFTAAEPWHATIGETKAVDWITVVPMSGDAGTVTMTVTVQPNTTYEERKATVTILCGGQQATIQIVQAGLPIPVESVTLDKEKLELTTGESAMLTATVKPDNAADKSVQWSSSAEDVATVSASGRVTAVSAGEAVITAKAGEKTAACTVVVSPVVVQVDTLSLDKTELALTEGESATLVATVGPEDATDKTVTWNSSDPAVATVEDGKVTAVAAGEAVITAKAGEKTAECKVTVAAKPAPAPQPDPQPAPQPAVIAVSSITLDQVNLILQQGASWTLTATVGPENATDKTVSWISSNPAVATVENGKVTAVSVGEAVITAKAGDQTAECKVTVNPIPVSSIVLDQTELTLEVGKTATLVATVGPDDATDKTVSWSSSNPAVASVDASGVVTAIKSGEAVITAQAGEKTAECKVTVPVPAGGTEGIGYGEEIK